MGAPITKEQRIQFPGTEVPSRESKKLGEDWIVGPSESLTKEFRHDGEKSVIPSGIITNKKRGWKDKGNHPSAGTLIAPHISPLAGCCVWRGDGLPAFPGEKGWMVQGLMLVLGRGGSVFLGTLASAKTTGPASRFFLQISGLSSSPIPPALIAWVPTGIIDSPSTLHLF